MSPVINIFYKCSCVLMYHIVVDNLCMHETMSAQAMYSEDEHVYVAQGITFYNIHSKRKHSSHSNCLVIIITYIYIYIYIYDIYKCTYTREYYPKCNLFSQQVVSHNPWVQWGAYLWHNEFPRQWCCEESSNSCNLFRIARPTRGCVDYPVPWWGKC